MDDDELISAIAGGDDTALRELFARHAPWLAARLRSMLPAAEVEDVLQESFLAVWRGARGYHPEGSPGGWLWGITRRQAALWLRRRGPEGSTTQEVWRLMYLEDRTVSEVAGLMGVPEGTVKSRAHRVRQLMRAVLRPVADGGGR